MEKIKQKTYKGEKYIYLLMGYKLAQINNLNITIGKDSGFKGGQNYIREFKIQKYEGKTLLTETKTSSGFADFSRTFEVIGKFGSPIIKDYINSDGENAGQRWTH